MVSSYIVDFFLTTVYSKVGIVTKHFTSGHFVYNELGRVSIHTASKEITDSFPYSDHSIFLCFCTVVNKWWEWCNVPCVFPLLSFLKVVILHRLRESIGQIQTFFFSFFLLYLASSKGLKTVQNASKCTLKWFHIVLNTSLWICKRQCALNNTLYLGLL